MQTNQNDQRIANLTFELQLINRALLCMMSALKELFDPQTENYQKLDREVSALKAQSHRIEKMLRARVNNEQNVR